MNANQFRALVRSLEGFERKNPVSYRLVVALLAGLGYGYIFLIVALLLGVVCGMGYGVYYLVRYSGAAGVAMIGVVKIGIPVALALLAVAQALVRSLNVSIPAPDGPELTREAAPRLFSMLDGICTTLRAPRIQRVLLDEDFNAGVLQIPRYGLLGFQTNYLILGLPLMQALSMEQFRAVLAHEIGHVSGNHSRFSGWIYRLRKTWFTVLEHLGHNIVFSGFFHWYAPYFWAVSFVLARSNEYVADRCSAEVVGKQVAAETLLSIAVKARYLDEKFWPEVYKAADVHDRPVGAPYTAMHQSLRTAAGAADSEEWLEELLRQRSEIDDTHPALSDRLGALGYPIAIGGPLDRVECPLPLPPPSEENAAGVLLERIAGPFAGKLDEEWRSGVAQRWAEVHRDAQIARNRWAGLSRHRQEGGSVAPEQLWELASLTARFDAPIAAAPVLKALLQASPHHVQANFVLGRLLLEENNQAGISLLQNARRLDPKFSYAVDDLIAGYWKRQTVQPRPAAVSSPRPAPRPVPPPVAQTRVPPPNK